MGGRADEVYHLLLLITITIFVVVVVVYFVQFSARVALDVGRVVGRVHAEQVGVDEVNIAGVRMGQDGGCGAAAAA